MNQKELKNKVYQLLFDKIVKEDFKKDILLLQDVYKAKTDSLLYDLSLVHYENHNYKQQVIEVISKYTTKEELISLKIYQDCIRIIETTDQKTAFHHSVNLGEVFVNSEHKYKIVYDFHRLNEELSYIKDDLVETKEEDVYFNIKKCARAVTEAYNNSKQKQQWSDFLHTSLTIIKHKESVKNKQKEAIISQAISELANLESKSKVKRMLKENGFTDEEIANIMKLAESASKEAMNKQLPALLTIGTILSFISFIMAPNKGNVNGYGALSFLIGIGLLASAGFMFWKIKKKKK
ncbi:hypothetical protein [Kordia jejudonensis]|uniref:hypothetical protein n=1 Tax=Kordia jejudonensis TaxID=1348245 RepID=UPI00062933A2|nr:hypothetical protein [Kordia jejudonensis]